MLARQAVKAGKRPRNPAECRACPPTAPSMLKERLQQLLSFSRFLARRFSDDQCFEAAGALSYTTIFAMVPLLTVSLSVFASFQEFRDRKSVV